jgi:hypothetical protein
MKARLAKVAAEIAAIRERRMAAEAPQIVARELRAVGVRATAWSNGNQHGVTVDTWDSEPELDAVRERKLAELGAKGISTFVVVIDRMDSRPTEVALGSGDRVGGGGLLDGASTASGPVTPRAAGQRERAQTPPAKDGRSDV